MKKFLALILALTMGIATSSVMANSLFAKGDVLGSFTLGFGDGFGQRFAVDYGLVDGWIDGKASLGLGASFSNTLGWQAHWDAMSLIINASFHYQVVDKLDAYAVLGVGGRVAFSHQRTHGGADWTSALGLRYFIDSKWGLNLEAGHTNGCYINMGVSWKF